VDRVGGAPARNFARCKNRPGDKSSLHTALFFPGRFGGVLVPPNANASMPSPTPADFSADMTLGGSGHADTINSYPTRAACFSDLRCHPVRLMKRRECNCLCRRRDG